MERDSTKRKVKPTPLSALLNYEISGESSEDSDFRIEDHCDASDDDSLDSDESSNENANESGSEDKWDDSYKNNIPAEELLLQAESQKQKSGGAVDPVKIMICCVCLGDSSDAVNEIVECDGCGVTVHEGCYGVSEDDSISSTVSSCSTVPWFCEACRAGVNDPTCELCPNSGGIFKETDTGKWVHLVCALYIPGVAFDEVEKLSGVTLFEMPYTKWGARLCLLCADQRFAQTGVCVGCDAGFCRSYFHVTCGQREGLLSEAHSEEVDQADPFYAHCKLHSDKNLVKKRRRNWLALELRRAERKKQYAVASHSNLPDQLRIKRKLSKYQQKYSDSKFIRPSPWVPTQKMARLLTTSAGVCRMLWCKASLSGVDTQAWVLREAQATALADVYRKWHIPPAFSVEFTGYYLDRNNRMESMKQQLAVLLEENSKLVEEQRELQILHDDISKEYIDVVNLNQITKSTLQKYYDVILKVVPDKKLLDLGKLAVKHHHPLASHLGRVPTPAALKMEVGFPLGLKMQGIQQRESPLGLCVECGICNRTNDQHLMAKCDTCHLHYHLGCLNPPLTRMPKKTKLMGWQCSECDEDASGSEVECLNPDAPRQLRKLMGNGDVTPPMKSEEILEAENEKEFMNAMVDSKVDICSPVEAEVTPGPIVSGRSSERRRRQKRVCFSPDLSGSNRVVMSRKRKHKSVDTPEFQVEQDRPALKIFLKSIPHPAGKGSAYAVTPGGIHQASTSHLVPTPSTHSPPANQVEEADKVVLCSTCNLTGTNVNIVRCDECNKGFHFQCLDPPVKKTPKVRGYSWHCAECDPTESDSN